MVLATYARFLADYHASSERPIQVEVVLLLCSNIHDNRTHLTSLGGDMMVGGLTSSSSQELG